VIDPGEVPPFLNPSRCMTSEAAVPGNNDVPRGLPPVTPPSGRFILQLFLVPGLIIAVVVAILVGFGYLVGGSRTTANYLRDLDSPNADVRWRGAHDLAQVLKRPESLALASDPMFALDITQRLRDALAELEEAERATAKRAQQLTPPEQEAAWRALAPQRNHVLYLTACLGDFTVPVGVAVLSDMAEQEGGPDLKGTTLRRRRAVWALANLGENVKRRYLGIDAAPGENVLSDTQKKAIVAELKQESAGGGDRAAWAQDALCYVDRPKPNDAFKPACRVRVDQTLEQCARAEDPYLRSLVALALNFWDGDRVEPALLRLAQDDGHGPRIEIRDDD
jgi:hypothetical protein